MKYEDSEDELHDYVVSGKRNICLELSIISGLMEAGLKLIDKSAKTDLQNFSLRLFFFYPKSTSATTKTNISQSKWHRC